MTKEERKEYMKLWNLQNANKVKQYKSANKEKTQQIRKEYYNSLGSGVYVACLNERILYIGQSKQLRKRISDHKTIYKKREVKNLSLLLTNHVFHNTTFEL